MPEPVDKTSDVQHPYIVKTPGTCGGRARVEGTRLAVWHIVDRYLSGQTPTEILTVYPRLTPAALFAALSYYYDHKHEIDADLAEHSEEAYERMKAEWQREHGPAPVPAR
jgi:uncharacterized protein (DUF433 family)